MTHQPHNAIRKAAILVSGLDTAAADALLGGMPPEVAARVRNAVMDLDEIDPAEQRRVLEEFHRASGGAPRNDAADDGVELDTSLARRIEESRSGETTYHLPPEREQPPFHFLHDADAAVLAEQLAREHAQTIAVVLAHLRPAHAADVLGQLAPEQQMAVLGRLADLDQAAPEVLREIEQQLQTALMAHTRANERRANGRSTISAILNAAAPHLRRQLSSRLERGSTASNPAPAKAANPAIEEKTTSHLAGAIERLNRAAARPAPGRAMPERTVATSPTPAAAPRVAVAFDELVSLDDRSLALVLQTAGPQLTLLALAGANAELVGRLLRRLPAREGQVLRQRVEGIGPVRVRDMEAAQEELARVAGELAATHRISVPARRRLSLAA